MMRPTTTQLVQAAVAALVIGVSLEATVRLDDWAQFGVSPTAPAIAMNELLVRDSLGVHARPGAAFKQFQISPEGFRGAPFDRASFEGVLIVAAGASETFGLYEKPGGDWPRQLEDSLAPRCRTPVRVLNAAFAGMSLPTVTEDYSRRLAPLRPQVVVYYPTPMQYLEAKLPVAAEPSPTPPAPLSPWRSRAVPRFREAFKRAAPEALVDRLRQWDTQRSRAAGGTPVRVTAEPERLDAFERDLRALVGRYRTGGATPVLIQHRNRFTDTTGVEAQRWLRAWERFYPLYAASAILAFDDAAAERVARVGADSAVLVIDPREVTSPLGTAAFADFSHFTDAGSARVGGLAARRLAPLVCAPM
ncbi:MAG: hypothetical protein LCH84_05515 [Gemmatimonadetes bacterium]|nr:hypothetical protein [Gemmatimonadota bacterium]